MTTELPQNQLNSSGWEYVTGGRLYNSSIFRGSLGDFCTEDKDESGPIFSIQPLQMAEVQNQNRLMVITCAYQLGEMTKKGRPLFSIAPSSVAFHLFESIQA